MSTEASFLALANPQFDFRTMVSSRKQTKQRQQVLPFELRASLLDQPPLANNEKIPYFYALEPCELALSTIILPSYFHMQLIGFYVPERHRPLAQLALQEFANPDYLLAHGTLDTYRQGCKGPLCRRAYREERATQTILKLTRTASRTDPNSQSKQIVLGPAARQNKLSRGAPQYAAVNPLLVALTVYSHQVNPAPHPTKESKIYQQLTTLQNLQSYILHTFPQIVK